mmetsp:Transcript_33867/g.49181  ORF Transcript_33867/g.49181 Transcript_33867/m.49181 type:complete len:521 (-) Transcript_33867:442-2004(-)
MSSNSTYEASELVRSMHQLPHLNQNLQKESSQFNVTFDSGINSYVISLFPLPIMIGSIGLLMLLILQCSLCCRRYSSCCKCNWIMKSRSAPPFLPLYATCIVLMIFALAANQILIFGSQYLSNGVNNVDNALSFLSTTFVTLNNYGTDLSIEGNTIVQNFGLASTATCDTQPLIEEMNSVYFPNVNLYNSDISGVPNNCNTASDNLNQYGITLKNEVIWLLYAVLTIGILLYSIGLFFKHKLTLKGSIAIAEILMFVFFFICTVEMIALMLFSDFCMSPMTNILLTLNPGSNTYDVFAYYTTCTGVNPLESYLNSSEVAIQELKYSVQSYYLQTPLCSSSYSYLNASVTAMNDVLDTYADINTQIACPPLENQISEVLETGLCDQVFQGFYAIWLSQYVSNACLFFVTIVVSVIYQHFGRYWGRNNEDDEEGMSNNFESTSEDEVVLHINTNAQRNSSSDTAYVSNEYTYYNTMNAVHTNNPNLISYGLGSKNNPNGKRNSLNSSTSNPNVPVATVVAKS